MPLAQDAKACARTLLSRLNSRGVEPPTRGRGRIAEVRAPCPKVDAGGVGLGGVFRGPGEGCPSPRPDRVEPELAPDLPGGESFALDDTEPAVPAEPVPPAPAGLEPEREPDPTARDADRGEVPHCPPELEAKVDGCGGRVQCLQCPSREVDLADDRGRLGHGMPPVSGLAACGSRLRDQQVGLGSARSHRLDELEYVRPVPLVGSTPRRSQMSTVELVEGDHWSVTAGDLDGR